MYTTDNIFPVIPIKHLVNQDGEPNTPHKLATGTKPSVSKIHVLFFPFVVQNATANIDPKALNMRHKSQKGFRGIFVEIPQHQKGYLIYVPSTRKIVYSHDVVFDKTFSSALSYTPLLYSKPFAMLPAVRESTSQSILLDPIYFLVLEKKVFLPSFSFF